MIYQSGRNILSFWGNLVSSSLCYQALIAFKWSSKLHSTVHSIFPVFVVPILKQHQLKSDQLLQFT